MVPGSSGVAQGTMRGHGAEAIVTLLDATRSGAVESTWRRIDRELGLRGVLVTPYPHFSYLVADRLDPDGLGPRLTELARGTAPFAVRVRGMARFPEPWPVVYLRVVPDARLREFHRSVWGQAGPCLEGPLDYYRPERWVPHITIAHGDESRARPLTSAEAESVERRIPRTLLEGTVLVDHLALILEREGRQVLGPRFVLEGTQKPRAGRRLSRPPFPSDTSARTHRRRSVGR